MAVLRLESSTEGSFSLGIRQRYNPGVEAAVISSRRIRVSRESVHWLAAGVLFAGVLVVLRLMIGGGVFAQQIGWPTPPPGRAFSVPSEEQIRAPITVSVERPGSEVEIIRSEEKFSSMIISAPILANHERCNNDAGDKASDS